jgi:hypothetical protein
MTKKDLHKFNKTITVEVEVDSVAEQLLPGNVLPENHKHRNIRKTKMNTLQKKPGLFSKFSFSKNLSILVDKVYHMQTITSYLLFTLLCTVAWAQNRSYNFPTVDELPVIEELPDPFIMEDGTRVETLADWEKQREYLKAMIQHYEYGFRPPVPEDVTVREESSQDIGWAFEKELTFTVNAPSGSSFSFLAGMRIPKGEGPFPIVIKNDRSINNIPASEEGVRRGYIMMDYRRTDLDPDLKLDQSGNVGAAESAYPDYNWATLQIWSWGFSVIIDWLETQDYVDITKITATGQSRGGKTALLAGAMDERIALTVPSGSGAGGCGNFRFAREWGRPDGAESLDRISSSFTHWFVPEFNTFGKQVTRLPFDQHTVKALVAPRALLCTDALGDYWANPWGSQQTHEAAKEVYKFFNVPEKIGIHYREGGHSQNEEDIIALLDFADFIFKNKPLPADYYEENFDIDESQRSWEFPRK